MVRRRLFSVLAALALVLSGFSVGVTAQAGGSGHGSGQSGVSEMSPLKHRPTKKCKKWKRQARKGNKKAARKFKKHCKRRSGGGGGGGGGGGAATCDPYKPGTEGAEAETSVVTDANTEEAPLEVTVPASEGIPEADNASSYHNVQVNSSAAHTGLWVRFEFAEPEDMDLYLLFADSSEAAHAAGYNPAPVPGATDGTGNGGHSEMGAEQLDGIGTDDCGGYTVDMRPFQNAPGDKTLKLWLGEAGCEPPCGEP